MELFGSEIDWRRLIRHIARITRHAEAEDLAHVAVVRTLERGVGDIANPEAFLVRAAAPATAQNLARGASFSQVTSVQAPASGVARFVVERRRAGITQQE